jgi:hypothetical protein
MATKVPNESVPQKIARFRKIAEDKLLPQDVRNEYLDKANELEKSLGNLGMAKGGAVVAKKKMNMDMSKTKPAMAKGGAASKKPMKAMEKKPAIAIMIGVGKPKMAKGGMTKKGGK